AGHRGRIRQHLLRERLDARDPQVRQRHLGDFPAHPVAPATALRPLTLSPRELAPGSCLEPARSTAPGFRARRIMIFRPNSGTQRIAYATDGLELTGGGATYTYCVDSTTLW